MNYISFQNFYSIKVRNYCKIIEMNWHDDNFIALRFNSIQFWNKIIELNWLSKKKLLSNWQRQFNVWPWIAEGYISVLEHKWIKQFTAMLKAVVNYSCICSRSWIEAMPFPCNHFLQWYHCLFFQIMNWSNASTIETKNCKSSTIFLCQSWTAYRKLTRLTIVNYFVIHAKQDSFFC